MRRLDVVGPFKGASGYDRHTREFVRQFVRQGVRVRLTDLHVHGWSTELPRGAREEWFESLNVPVDADTTLHFTMPVHARPRRGRRNVNYTMFEADRIPPLWVERAPEHDLIVVPTESGYRAWADSGVPEDHLRICPLGVDAAFFAEPAEPLRALTPDGRELTSFRHRFLNVAELRPRKNHLGLLRSWMRATTRDDDAVLILKLSVFDNLGFSDFQSDLRQMQRAYGLALEDAAPVVVVAGVFPDSTLRSLYATATHYVSMSRGEGWDQAMMEAAVAGLQLIAPRHTSYLSNLADTEVEWIPVSSQPVEFEGRLGRVDLVFFRGLHWWTPDEEAAAASIRAIIRGEAEPRITPRERIAREYTWERAAARLLEIVF
jgi:glycosyltransferase involved in cell wall biosynthesis